MQGSTPLRYGGNDLVKRDIKKLKRWPSLADNLKDHYKIVRGTLAERLWPPPVDWCGGVITQISCDLGTLLCYKDRLAISNPIISAKRGARLIYALISEEQIYLPLLIFPASQEGKFYEISGKKFALTSSNFGKIINEKIATL